MKRTHTLLSSLAVFILSPSAIAQCGPSMVTTMDGDTAVYTCPGDQVPDVIPLMNTASSGETFAYIVTDEMNMVLSVPGDVMEIDVEDAGPGICRVWGVTYSGTLNVEMGDDLMMADLASGCEQLSSNFVSLYRDMPEAGAVNIPGMDTDITVIAGDGDPDVVEFENSSTSISNYAYIITDENNLILGVEHVPMHDFEPAGPGVCLVYGVSYTGNLNAPMGEDIAMIDLSDDCWDLSANFITVTRLSVGVDETSDVDLLRIMPSLAEHTLFVEADPSYSGGILEVFDVNGRSVHQMGITNSGRIEVPVDMLAPGQYLCAIVHDRGRAVGRFIKQ